MVLGRESFAWRAPSLAERHDVGCILRIAGGFLAGVTGGTYPRELVSRWIDQARKADVIVAQTESVAASLVTLGLSRIRIIPNGVDLARFAQAPKDETLLRRLGIDGTRIVVMHVSNLKPLKRAMDLVSSAAVAVEQDRRLIYVVVGDGADRGAMEAACRRRGIIDHFRFVGWVPYDRVPAYLNLADIVVMPSELEAQARVYLETQACGRVLLASDIAAARHVISDGDTGLLFRRGDIAELARRTLDAAADRGVRARIGARARQRVVAHALDEVARAYGQAIDDIIAARRIALPAPTDAPGDDSSARRAPARRR
jgi:glycosyltransferase involved in cell wall biosynthesis